MATSASQTPLDVAIIGGGIAGLTVALGLLKQPNVKVTIYESARQFGEIGAGVAFGPNAVRAMSLIDPNIKHGLDNCATSNLWDSKKEVWFDFRHGQDAGQAERAGKPIYSLRCPGGHAMVHRADFLDELIKLIPSGITHFGKRVVGLEELEDQSLRLKFKDGSEATHAAAIGCDGIKSEVRKYVLGKDNPASHAEFTGKYCHRGLIPMPKAAGLLGDELAQNSTMYLGRHGHILTFPVQKGKTMNVVAFSSQDSWDSKDWVIPSTQADLLADYESWGAPVQKLLTAMQDTDIWALFDHAACPAPTYIKNRVCLIGDAAHASTPHQGSGAGMAIEDAYVLSSLLGKAAPCAEHVARAFRAFDAVRRQRTLRLVSSSRQVGKLWDFEDVTVGGDEGRFRDRVSSLLEWIWNEDLPKEVEVAMRIMDHDMAA